MMETSDLRMTRIPIKHGTGQMPALGFGTLIPDAALTIAATKDALEAGFRHFDCAERYRPERVEPAFEASLERLGLAYLDLYLIHTPFAFQSGDEQDPRDQNGNVLYDRGVTLFDTWKALESLVDHGKCRAIGLSDITLTDLK